MKSIKELLAERTQKPEEQANAYKEGFDLLGKSIMKLERFHSLQKVSQNKEYAQYTLKVIKALEKEYKLLKELHPGK